MTCPTPVLPEIRVSRAGLWVWFIPLVGFGLAWNVLLLSGYDLGQLIYGARVLVSDAPGGGDVSRSFAYSGLALLTTLPRRLGGAVGALGCVGLLVQQQWAFIPLVLSTLLLFCPLLVWIVTLAFWMPLDPLGSVPLLAQAVITALTGIGFPVLALFLRRPRPAACQVRQSIFTTRRYRSIWFRWSRPAR